MSWARKAAITAASIVLGLFCLGPLFWFIRAALTPERLLYRFPASIFPAAVTGDHFGKVLLDPSVWRYLANSLVVCSISTALALLLGSMAAWGLARGKVRGGPAIMAALLGVHLIPGMTSVAALYRLADWTGLLNTLTGVILIKAGSLTLAVWLMHSYFSQVPRSLEDAAKLDGCSEWAVFTRIHLPLCLPGLFAAGLLLFIGSWNSFFLPYVLLTDPEKMTATVGIYRYVGENGLDIGAIAAMTLVVVTPLIAVFLIFQRRIRNHLYLKRT